MDNLNCIKESTFWLKKSEAENKVRTLEEAFRQNVIPGTSVFFVECLAESSLTYSKRVLSATQFTQPGSTRTDKEIAEAYTEVADQ